MIYIQDGCTSGSPFGGSSEIADEITPFCSVQIRVVFSKVNQDIFENLKHISVSSLKLVFSRISLEL